MARLSGSVWAVGEGLVRSVAGGFAKALGSGTSDPLLSGAMGFVAGVLQALYGTIRLCLHGASFRLSFSPAACCLAFGAIAALNTFLGVYVFTIGAPLGTSIFLRSLSVVFAAIMVTAIQRRRPAIRTILAVPLSVFAGWLILRSPSLEEVWTLPLWMWLSLLIAVGAAGNEMLMSKLAAMRGSTSEITVQFWTGTTAAVLSLPLFIGAMMGPGIGLRTGLLIAVIGILVVVQISWRFFAYAAGKEVVRKKLITQYAYTCGAVCIGTALFAEDLTIMMSIGFALGFLSLLFADARKD